MKINTITRIQETIRRLIKEKNRDLYQKIRKKHKSDTFWIKLAILNDIAELSDIKGTIQPQTVLGRLNDINLTHPYGFYGPGSKIAMSIMHCHWLDHYLAKNKPLSVYFPEDMDMVHIIKNAGKKTDTFWGFGDKEYVNIILPGSLDISTDDTGSIIKASTLECLTATIPKLVLSFNAFIPEAEKCIKVLSDAKALPQGIEDRLKAGFAVVSQTLQALVDTLGDKRIYLISSHTSVTSESRSMTYLEDELRICVQETLPYKVYGVEAINMIAGFGLYLKAFPDAMSDGVPSYMKEGTHKHAVTEIKLDNRFPQQDRTMSPHYRCGSFVTYSHERYTNMRGKTEWREGCFVKQACEPHTVDDVYPDVTKEHAEAV